MHRDWDFKKLSGLGSEFVCTGIGGLKGLCVLEGGLLCTGIWVLSEFDSQKLPRGLVCATGIERGF